MLEVRTLPGIVTALRFPKAPPPQTVTILWMLRLGSRTGDTPGVQLQGKEAESWGLKGTHRGPVCNAKSGPFWPSHCYSTCPLRWSPAGRALGRCPQWEVLKARRGRGDGEGGSSSERPLPCSASPPALPSSRSHVPGEGRGGGSGEGRGIKAERAGSASGKEGMRVGESNGRRRRRRRQGWLERSQHWVLQ